MLFSANARKVEIGEDLPIDGGNVGSEAWKPMQDNLDQQPGASGRRWEARFRIARQRRGGTEPSQFEIAIAKGNAGEEALGRELTALAQEMELAVLHDLTLSGKKANIDHLVIGPTGVTVVDAKAWEGSVWIGDKTMRQGRRSRLSHVQGVTNQVRRVEEALGGAGLAEVEVEGLICLVNGNRGTLEAGLKWCAGVGVGNVPSVRRRLSRGGAIGADDLARINDALQQAFVVHGGAYFPQRPASATASEVANRPSMAPPRREASFESLIEKLNEENARDELTRKQTRTQKLRRLAAGLAACVALASVVDESRKPEQQTTPSVLSPTVLQALEPQIRAAAADRAGGKVRGPAVDFRPDAVSLRYRRGQRCRVRVTVDPTSRLWSLSSRGCARR